MNLALVIYAAAFIAFTFVVGHTLRTKGYVFLSHTFNRNPAVADSVQFLLSLGFYLLCAGLLLWNLGEPPVEQWSFQRVLENASVRLGVSIFVVAVLHSFNILVLAILNRNNSPSTGA